MGVSDIAAARSLLAEELEAVTETGLYDRKEAFLAHAVEVLLTARPDLREAEHGLVYILFPVKRATGEEKRFMAVLRLVS